MNVFTATISVLGKYAKFTGRVHRDEFWNWMLAQLLLYVVVYFLIKTFAPDHLSMATKVFFSLFLIPDIALQFRRLQDCNIRGVYSLLFYIPLFYFLFGSVWINWVGGDLEHLKKIGYIGISSDFPLLNWTMSVVLFVECIFLLMINIGMYGTLGANRFGPEHESD